MHPSAFLAESAVPRATGESNDRAWTISRARGCGDVHRDIHRLQQVLQLHNRLG